MWGSIVQTIKFVIFFPLAEFVGLTDFHILMIKDNDRSGIRTNKDRLAVRKVFSQAWNNPSVG